MKRSTRTLATVAGVVALAAVAAVVYFLTRTAPAAVTIDDAVAGAQTTPSPSEEATTDAEPQPLEGAWSVDTAAVAFDFGTSAGSFLGFRIDEELSSVGATEAVGRTPAVTGEIAVSGTTLEAATIEGSVEALTTDDSRRDRKAQAAIAASPLSFTLTGPVELRQPEAIGEVVEVQATGDLTVNGVTREVTLPLSFAYAAPELLVVTGSFEVTLLDHEISKPTAPFVLSIADVGTVELQLYLSQA